MNDRVKKAKQVFRVDRFKVPAAALPEFTARARAAHQRLCMLPGFVEDRLLESSGQHGVTTVVTVVVWKDRAACDRAKREIERAYRQSGYDPQKTLKRLGIEADRAVYTELQR